jgi:hypothetical protein
MTSVLERQIACLEGDEGRNQSEGELREPWRGGGRPVRHGIGESNIGFFQVVNTETCRQVGALTRLQATFQEGASHQHRRPCSDMTAGNGFL